MVSKPLITDRQTDGRTDGQTYTHTSAMQDKQFYTAVNFLQLTVKSFQL